MPYLGRYGEFHAFEAEKTKQENHECQCLSCGRFPDYYKMFKEGVPEEDQPGVTCFSCRKDEDCTQCPMGNGACTLWIPAKVDLKQAVPMGA